MTTEATARQQLSFKACPQEAVGTSVAAACGMYLMWGGILPLYWRNVRGIGALETLAHRILWGALLIAVVLGPKAVVATLKETFSKPGKRVHAALGALVIGANWLIYIWGVRKSHMTEASLGYYIGPLMSLMLGHWVLKEPLRPLQWLACLMASLGVGHLVLVGGRWPVFGLALATSFSLYGLLRKLSGLRGLQGFVVETTLLIPFAIGLLAVVQLRGEAQFWGAPKLSQVLLMASGIFGSVPIVLFGVAAQRLPLTTLGMMQFLAPTLGLMMAVFVFGETLSKPMWVVFSGIWFALGLWLLDSLKQLRRQRS